MRPPNPAAPTRSRGPAWARPTAPVMAVAVVAGLLGVLTLSLAGRSVWPPLLLGAALFLFVTACRFRPLGLLGVLLAASVVAVAAGLQPSPLLFLPAGFLLYLVTVEERPRIAVFATTGAVGVAAAEALLSSTQGAQGVANIVPAVLVVVIAWAVGQGVRQRRVHLVEMRARAVTEERLRIARELHDVVAHGISVIAVQAGFGRHVIDTQPATARTALDAINSTSREVTAELRHLLGVLRREEHEPADLQPTPGLADLDRLVARTVQAGVRPHLERTGRPRELPAGVDLSAYRIVQEALTNVVRHAATGSCHVVLDYRHDELAIEVTDHGSGGQVRRGGHGLIGLRERTGLYGGEFTAGPLPAGGFRVTARLPIDDGPADRPAARRTA